MTTKFRKFIYCMLYTVCTFAAILIHFVAYIFKCIGVSVVRVYFKKIINNISRKFFSSLKLKSVKRLLLLLLPPAHTIPDKFVFP